MGFESSRDSWTRYWRGGNQDTCFTSIGTFSIAERWRAFFRELADGASILDLATGNGTVALLAARVSEERPIPFSITAVDQAAIDPAQSLREPPALLKSIAFIPDTMLEELPFDAARFDAVCSQFGFEYADTSRSINQIARVCRPAARLCLFIHAQNGEVDRSSKNRRKRVQVLLEKESLLGVLNTMAQLQLKPSVSTRARIQKLEAGFWNKARKSLELLSNVAKDDVALNSIHYMVSLALDRRQIATEEFNALVKDMYKELRAYVVRLNTMINAAKSEKEIAAICKELEENGFDDCHFAALADDNGNVAWQLKASRQQYP